MHALLGAQARYQGSTRRRGLAGQQELREEERTTRERAARLVEDRSLTLREGAELLQVSESTLWDWAELGTKRLVSVGRRPTRGAAPKRNAVLTTLNALGLAAGLDRVAALHHEVPRNEVRELIRRRRAHDAGLPRAGEREILRWQRPGVAWAMDFTRLTPIFFAPCSFVSLALVVRDLASHYVLAVVPAESESAAVVEETLSRLLLQHGAPLVLKSDNGSAFVAAKTKELCSDEAVQTIFNPPACPSYNGALEASNAWLKRDLAHLASQVEEDVSLADLLEAARVLRNRTGRPWGAAGPTPEERWLTREPLSEHARTLLGFEVRLGEIEDPRSFGFAQRAALNHNEEAAIRRQVLRRALVEHGYLEIRRRRVSL